MKTPGKGITTEELKEPKVTSAQDGQASESQDNEAMASDKDEKKKGFSKYTGRKESD